MLYKTRNRSLKLLPSTTTEPDLSAPSELEFSGNVYLELIHRDPKVATANVTFAPCARIHWHTHEEGQVIKVTTGNGWICDKGKKPRRIKAGDVI
ncbi:uncharacterized protein ANIA_11086 [Aspergillus nidulans FGSC A4]|uniref:Cupin 2 conserved barrel domain-containing protein n=1 Tax=Emericella nidulans (strain FGSC A4 / ATCC 38163 / CBS 112.46 / NRRL 194 / M139) TaxID=227321 RepID=C8VED1_EMENI|nr:hypothetical protein [Aspergillus nidulans FGSC A4]CBF80522.1 TPA: conserved hypothetical protein [Aspergillus nidulans FGSC A4]